jgi:hypothetical protein
MAADNPFPDALYDLIDTAAAVESCPECGTVTDIEYRDPEDGMTDAEADDALVAAVFQEDFDVPFRVQSFMFEALIEGEVEHLHDLIEDHREEIVEMARARHKEGYIEHGSKGYGWDAATRLRNVLEELADAPTYLTMGPIE